MVTAPCEAVRPASPLVYRNNGSGRFSPLAPEHSFSDDETFGYRAMLIEEHGEGAVDFVAWELSLGADGIWRRRGVSAFGDAAEQDGRRPLRCAFPR